MKKETQKQKDNRYIREGKARDRFKDKVEKNDLLYQKFCSAACYNPIAVGVNGLTRKQLEKLVNDKFAYRVEKFNGKCKRVLYGRIWQGN